MVAPWWWFLTSKPLFREGVLIGYAVQTADGRWHETDRLTRQGAKAAVAKRLEREEEE